MWKRSMVLLAALIMGLSVNAGSLSSGDLPEGSNWYLHVNVELMRNSTIGQQ